MKKNKIKIIIAGVLLLFVLGGLFYRYVKPTSIAFINFRDFQYAEIMKAKPNMFVKLKRYDLRETKMPRLTRFKAIYLFGMGLHLKPEQQLKIKQAIKKGSKVYVYAATSTGSDLTNLTGKDLKAIEGYFENSGKKNFTNLLNYSRRVFDNKKLFTQKISEPHIIPRNLFFHLDKEAYYPVKKDYQLFYETRGYYDQAASNICIVTSNLGPKNPNNRGPVDALIIGLESAGHNVYPIAGFTRRFEFIKSVEPDLVILMPHGRMIPGQGEALIAYLKEKNIPVMCALQMYRPYEEWSEDQIGMSGGMLSQSMVMPELDGAIDMQIIGAQFKNDQGLYVFKAIPERVERMVAKADNWLKLKKADNQDKKLAIVYYKGPGLNAMVAGGLNVCESLFNTLHYLKSQGYQTGLLPKSVNELQQLIQKKGAVLGTYAQGTIKQFLKQGEPELIDVKTYQVWCQKRLTPDMIKNVVSLYGPAPGSYMNVEKEGAQYLAIARIQFGNVVILPQPMPAYGDESSKLIHGVKKAPPHSYIAPYLWLQYGFNADAVMHFGTHGSLEFTPWKQTALSKEDWPDALIGEMPHIYLYVINNIGEAIIAKRRSYATLVTHLTPPFTESELYAQFNDLHEAIHHYYSTEKPGMKKAYKNTVIEVVDKLNLRKDIGLKDEDPFTEEMLSKLHNYIHAIEQEKITKGLYSMGRSYTKKENYQTARLMAIDGLAYGLADMDVIKGLLTLEKKGNAHYFEEHYRQKAGAMIAAILKGEKDEFDYLDLKDQRRIKVWDDANKTMSDDEFFAGMIAMSGKKTGHKKAESVSFIDEEALINDVVAVAGDPEKKAFIEELKKEKNVDRIFGLLDPVSMKKAMKIAKLIPAMQEKLKFMNMPDVLQLVGKMQDENVRQRVFELLKDKKLQQRVAAQQVMMRKKRAEQCLDKKTSNALLILFKGSSVEKTIVDKQNVAKLKEIIIDWEFYLKNKNLAEIITDMDHPMAKAVSTMMTSSAYTERLEKGLELAQARLVDLEAKEAAYVRAAKTYSNALLSVKTYYRNLQASTGAELSGVENALNGGYIAPSSGGDAIVNPQAVPTGRNLYAIDAEKTPTKEAWKTGVELAEQLLAAKLKTTGNYPKKVAFTLWGGEFIRGQGTQIAEIIYLLGIEPVRNSRGVVHDLKLIPMERLKRPRIDVVVQTSGQFRDIASSRINLIQKAVDLASQADDGQEYKNYVKEGTQQAEAVMKAKGLSPEEARTFSTARVFGGVNGNYGTAIMGLVESGDKWEKDKEITDQYMKNMGAVYMPGNWGTFKPGIFEGALQMTDTVVQPRSSSVNGPLSLDHVYEFMGGLNAVIRNVTGRDPDAYFNDLRNKHSAQVQGAKEAIWLESRTTLFNPKYIKGLQKEGASAAETFAESFRNTYGWNVMKPKVIDKALWDELHQVYIEDKHQLGMEKYFQKKNPFALQEMTAVMLETVRKGLWKPDAKVIKQLAILHARLVVDYKAGCSGFVCDNAKLRAMLTKQLDPQLKEAYEKQITQTRVGKAAENQKGMKLEKKQQVMEQVKKMIKENRKLIFILLLLIGVFAGALLWGMRRQRL